jgi:hypothetical protein
MFELAGYVSLGTHEAFELQMQWGLEKLTEKKTM